jgi:hypothetical protein
MGKDSKISAKLLPEILMKNIITIMDYQRSITANVSWSHQVSASSLFSRPRGQPSLRSHRNRADSDSPSRDLTRQRRSMWCDWRLPVQSLSRCAGDSFRVGGKRLPRKFLRRSTHGLRRSHKSRRFARPLNAPAASCQRPAIMNGARSWEQAAIFHQRGRGRGALDRGLVGSMERP